MLHRDLTRTCQDNVKICGYFMIQVKYPSLKYDWAYVLCAPNQRPLATLCSLSPVRRGGHNIPVTYLETRAHSQGQEQSCAVASFKSEMDGLKIIGRMETPFLAPNYYGSFMFCLQETSFLQPVQPTLAKTAVQIQSETFIL